MDNNSQTTLIDIANEMYEFTKNLCNKARKEQKCIGCCSHYTCEDTASFLKLQNIEIPFTSHPVAKYLDENNKCIIPSHQRPLCTTHVCEKLLWFNPEANDKYFELRYRFNEELSKQEI